MALLTAAFAEEKTEEATPNGGKRHGKRGRLQKVRTGPCNWDFSCLYCFKNLGSNMWQSLAGFMQQMFLYAGSWQGGQGDIQALVGQTILFLLQVLGPLFISLLLVGLAVNPAQVGFLWTTEALCPKAVGSILEGAKRIFSKRSLMELGKSIIKIVIVAYLAYSAVRKSFSVFLSTAQMPPLEGQL